MTDCLFSGWRTGLHERREFGCGGGPAGPAARGHGHGAASVTGWTPDPTPAAHGAWGPPLRQGGRRQGRRDTWVLILFWFARGVLPQTYQANFRVPIWLSKAVETGNSGKPSKIGLICFEHWTHFTPDRHTACGLKLNHQDKMPHFRFLWPVWNCEKLRYVLCSAFHLCPWSVSLFVSNFGFNWLAGNCMVLPPGSHLVCLLLE